MIEVDSIIKYGKQAGVVSLLFGIICIVVGVTLIRGEIGFIYVAGIFGTAFAAFGFALLLTYWGVSRKDSQ